MKEVIEGRNGDRITKQIISIKIMDGSVGRAVGREGGETRKDEGILIYSNGPERDHHGRRRRPCC